MKRWIQDVAATVARFGRDDLVSKKPLLQGRYGECPVELGQGVRYQLVYNSDGNDPIAQAYRDGHQANEYLTELLPRFTKEGSSVLDLGAHIGTFSLAAAALGRDVIAVDASPIHIDLLCRSVERNQLKSMRVVHRAVGETSGKVKFHVAGLWGMVARTGSEPNPPEVNDALLIEVKSIPGDRLLQRLGCEQVDLIKMDIEGSEFAAIRGLKALLGSEKAPVIAYECNGLTLPMFGHTTDDLLRLLESFGYTTHRMESGRFHPYRPGDFQPEAWIDVVAFKPRHLLEGAIAVDPALPVEELIARTLQEARMPHEVQRAYIAGALARAPEAISKDSRVLEVLERLTEDSSKAVRDAAQWFANARGGASGSSTT